MWQKFLLTINFICIIYTLNAQNKSHLVYQHSLHHSYQTGSFKPQHENELHIDLSENNSSINNWTISFIIVDHVNHPIGIKIESDFDINFLQLYNDTITILNHTLPIQKTVHGYWNQFIIINKQNEISIYQNSIKLGSLLKSDTSTIPTNFNIKALTALEPYMYLNDVLKEVNIYNTPFSKEEINDYFLEFDNAIENGYLPHWQPTFIVEPFVCFAESKNATISWETLEEQSTVIKYGTQYPLEEKIITNNHTQQNVKLTNLKPNTKYYAEVVLQTDTTKAYPLYFKTASEKTVPFRFGIIGDTESRPFINHQIAEHLWDNRPDFFTLLGDITDNGFKNRKEQWTMEFFTGMNTLMSKIPILPLAGNGDDDLYWFNKYFAPPSDKGYFKYHYANADFFILRSNQKNELTPSGEQYNWLERELEKSEADWKFVLMHHAPFSSDNDDYGDSYHQATTMGSPKVRKLVPLFEKYGVDVVFYGHLHCYERSWPLKLNPDSKHEVVYIESGGAGGNLEDFAPHRTWFSAKTYRGHHYIIANINNNRLRLDTYNIEGNLIDTYEIKK